MTKDRHEFGIKEQNKKKIYSFIYSSEETSKQEIANSLDLSLPTVTNNLNALIKEGLIEKCGQYESTGGRKAQIITLVKTARYAVGVSVFMSSMKICAVDLYGNLISETTHSIKYSHSDVFYTEACSLIKTFISNLPCPEKDCIGIGIATQGLVSQDGSGVIYGSIMGNENMTSEDFGKHLQWPCVLLHDTKASASAEIWRNNTGDAIYLLLNNNFGGVLVSRGKVHSGGSGLIEHMIIHPNGEKCYCGKNGCVESYCSADALRKSIRMSLDLFFNKLRSGDTVCKEKWNNYLSELALTIDNLRMIINYKVIIGGLLRQYMTQEDISDLKNIILDITAFKNIGISIELSRYGQNAAAIGAALSYIESFLSTVA